MTRTHAATVISKTRALAPRTLAPPLLVPRPYARRLRAPRLRVPGLCVPRLLVPLLLSLLAGAAAAQPGVDLEALRAIQSAQPGAQSVAELAGGSRTLCVRHRDGTVACHGTRSGGSPVVNGEGWQTLDAYAGATAIAVDDLGSALCAVFRSGRPPMTAYIHAIASIISVW